MKPTPSTPRERKDECDIEVIISSLPKEKSWWKETQYKYEGFWFHRKPLQGVFLACQTFSAQPDNVILATLPKSGTTWFAALLFTIMNRTRYDFSTHPLLTTSPHDLVPGIEFYASKNPSNPVIPSTSRLLATHIPYELLPMSVKSSDCPIIYVCRDPRDVVVSLWHFANKLRPKNLASPLGLEEAFDMFCKGESPFGSYWDHVLGYWKASLELPNKVLFMRYEDMKNDPITNMKKLASFVGSPFSHEEEESEAINKIADFCSFKSLTSFKVNVANNVFFRKGEIGDHKNYLSGEMIRRLQKITEMRFEASGLQPFA